MASDIAEKLAEVREVNEERKEKPEYKPFSLVPFGELEPRPLDWQVQGVYERNSLVVVFGDPGAAKTFWALDIAFCVASGTLHHGREVKAGPVVYIAGEGHNGLARRRKAWEIVKRVDLKEAPIFVSMGPAMLTDDINLVSVLAAIDEISESPELVVIDTLARNFGPGDENSTQDMTVFVRACDNIRTEHGCAVLLVHHTGHANKERQRGSTVLNGAIDVSYRLKRNEHAITVDHGKPPKDFPPVEPFAFEFQSVELGFENEDGTPATSAVLHLTDVPPPSKNFAPKLGKNERSGLSILDGLLGERGGDILRSDWRDACIKAGMTRDQFKSIPKSLCNKRLIFIDYEKVSRTKPGADDGWF